MIRRKQICHTVPEYPGLEWQLSNKMLPHTCFKYETQLFYILRLLSQCCLLSRIKWLFVLWFAKWSQINVLIPVVFCHRTTWWSKFSTTTHLKRYFLKVIDIYNKYILILTFNENIDLLFIQVLTIGDLSLGMLAYLWVAVVLLGRAFSCWINPVMLAHT